MKRTVVTVLGSLFYTGFMPVAPASFASFVWLVVYLFVPGGGMLANPWLLCFTVPFAVIVSGEMERYYGRDAHEIVIDEFVGMQISFIALEPSLVLGLIGFFFFRLFDVWKPFPVNISQKLKGGFGVVADDMVAGVYARLVLVVVIRLFSL
jgi:phosphatidylglycerophosphatase A